MANTILCHLIIILFILSFASMLIGTIIGILSVKRDWDGCLFDYSFLAVKWGFRLFIADAFLSSLIGFD